ncbi:MAG: hypothetical protein FWF96_06565 [Kiritimatiellaeota bacterium]|nr:hypothetical protein [Kiritimatiellota bacterium]
MLSQFFSRNACPGLGRGPRVAASLCATLLLGCSRGVGEAAPDAGEPAAPTNAAPGLVFEAGADFYASVKRAREAGDRLRRHREALIAANEEMGKVWREGIGQTSKSKAAEAKIMAFYEADPEDKVLREAFEAELAALRELRAKSDREQEALMRAVEDGTLPAGATNGVARIRFTGETPPANHPVIEKRPKQ